LAIAKAPAAKDPGNTLWQRDLSIGDEKVGDVLHAQGDLPGALATYRDSLAIRKALAAKDPGNAGWQRDLSIADEKVGDVLVDQGDLPGALAAYRDSLAIAKALAAKDPGNAQWRHDLAATLGSLSWTLILDRQPQEALDRAQEALALDPSALWVEASQAHALLFLGRFDEAKAIYLADKDKKLGKGTFADAVKDDFAQFRKYGIDTPDMKRIEALLAT
jgi:tetratricopeptide (TPR) repeat protein